MKAIHLTAYGSNPAQNVMMVDVPEPLPRLGVRLWCEWSIRRLMTATCC
jgi:hypothetical protein